MQPISTEQWRRVQQVLDGALALEPDDVSAYLDRACAGDRALRTEVARLLEACGRASGFLEDPPTLLAAEMLADLSAHEGRRVGPYVVVSRLGKGGMGVVYLAERADGQFHQRVALKLVSRGLETPLAVRRFLDERQILASLNHPNVARLLDGGVTEEGLPYFAMEYVEGTPIDRYCEARRLDVDARLRLFAEVCDAVQHAHQSLVVHRDLKPSNILVTAAGAPKLLDFGIAKLLQRDAPADATDTGSRFLTPRYASPEQLRGEPVTTVSDVYSLGVLLYELLTGRLPYDLAADTPAALERAVCETDPQRPSLALRDDRRARRLRGDLDTIVLKAMQKEPARRYASAGALAEDVRRHLAKLPVRARPDTLGYRASRFVRRRRALVASAAALSLAVVLGVAATATQASIAARERDRAQRQAETAARAAELLVDVFRLSDPDVARGTTITAREVLDRGTRRLERDFVGDPEVQAAMLRQVAQVYGNLGLYDDARRLASRAVSVWRPRGPSTELAAGLQLLGAVDTSRARFADAETHFREALAIRRALHDSADGVAESLLGVASALVRQQKHADAEPFYREATAVVRRAHGPHSPQLAGALYAQAASAHDRGEAGAADPLFREALDIYRGIPGSRDPLAATARVAVATDLLFRARYAEAEPLLREALTIRRAIYPDGHPAVVESLMSIATLCHNTSRFAEADSAVREAIAMGTRLEGPTHPDVLQALNILGRTLHDEGRYAEAERTFREALAGWRTLPGGEGSMARYARLLLAESELAEGKLDAARADYASAIDQAPARPSTLVALGTWGLAKVDLARGRADSAEAKLRQAVAMLAPRVRHGQHDLVSVQRTLAEALTRRGRHAEADSLLRALLAGERAALPPKHVDLARTLHAYGANRLALRDTAGAAAALREALAIRTARLGAAHPLTRETERLLRGR
jgi:serine/threonine-protein kinase